MYNIGHLVLIYYMNIYPNQENYCYTKYYIQKIMSEFNSEHLMDFYFNFKFRINKYNRNTGSKKMEIKQILIEF